MEAMQQAGQSIEIPETEPDEYLAAEFFRIGPAVPTGMGEAPISDRDILARVELSGVPFTPWEADALVEMSRAYLREKHNRNPHAISPLAETGDMTADRRRAIAAAMKASLRNTPKGSDDG